MSLVLLATVGTSAVQAAGRFVSVRDWITSQTTSPSPCELPVPTPLTTIDLTAAPAGGDLVVDIECRLDKRALKGELHEVTIHADWSVTTPHDLDAERVAMAFGGYTSCVPLVDTTVPALRLAMPAIARRAEVAPRRFGTRAWRVPKRLQLAGCCEAVSFRTLAEATSHLSSVAHLVRLAAAPVWQVRELTGIVSAHWRAANRERAIALGSEQHVGDLSTIDALWDHGIAADDIVRLARAVPVVAGPLPRAYFVGAHYGAASLDWLSTVVSGRPDAQFAAWVVGLPKECSRTNASHWKAWLSFGLPGAQVRFAVEQAGPPEVVADICAATGWAPAAAARAWLSWVHVGCRPTPEHFAVLSERGLADSVPSSAAIERLLAALSPALRSQRTELAVMLAVLGTVAEVVFEVNRGQTTAELVHRRGGRLLTASPPDSDEK